MIRRALVQDAEAIHELMLAAFTPFRAQYTDACFDATVLDPERIRQRMAEGPVWVAEAQGQLLGTVGARVDERGLYVRGMGVHPDARRQGMGRQLLDACAAHADTLGVGMWLSTTTFLTGSQRLYESFGFVPADGPADLHGTPLVSYAWSLPDNR